MTSRLMAAAAAAALFAAFPALAGDSGPPTLDALLEMTPQREAGAGIAEDKRHAAMRTAALAFAARAGLARRGAEISAMVERLAAQLSRVYRFRELMLEVDGFTVMPPVAGRTERAFRLDRDGARAARARRVIRILEPGRLVSAPPHWRDFLLRAWPAPDPPATVLFPRSAGEEGAWRQWLEEGWKRGEALADDIFAADLDRLNRTFEGVILWRRLHLARMASAPEITVERVSVSGGGRTMRIGEALAAIQAEARLDPDPAQWTPLADGDPR